MERETVDAPKTKKLKRNFYFFLSLSLSARPNPKNQNNDNRTALHIAAAEGNVPAIEILLAGGADCGPTDRWQATPLLEAVKAKRAAAIDALLARGAAASGLGIDENALSGLLCSAAEAKDAELIALYIKAGAPCDAGDYDKR